MAAVLTGQMQDGLVEGHEYQPLMDGQAQQVGIGDLIVAEQPFEERATQCTPVGRNRLVVIPRFLGQPSQHCRGLFHTHVARLRPGHVAQKASFRKRTDSPLKTLSCEPLRHKPMVYVVFVEKRHQHIHVKQVPESLRQDPPPRLP